MTAAEDNERRFHAACVQNAPGSPRLALYRRLVRGTLQGVVQGVLPRTCAELETLGLLGPSLDSFLRERGPRTPHVRDVPREIVEHVASTWPAWLHELARLELAEFATSYEPRELDAGAGIALEAPLAFVLPVRLEAFQCAVQSGKPRTHDAHVLLFYRDATDHVRTLRLSPMAAALLRAALSGDTLQDALIAAGAETGIALDESVLASTASLLDDLGERGVLRL